MTMPGAPSESTLPGSNRARCAVDASLTPDDELRGVIVELQRLLEQRQRVVHQLEAPPQLITRRRMVPYDELLDELALINARQTAILDTLSRLMPLARTAGTRLVVRPTAPAR